jgi:hypothetical protein
MAQVAQTHQDKLPKLKKSAEDWRIYFQKNIDRFNDFRRFVFSSTLTDDDVTNLQDLQKPVLEFNILEPYISRLCGEFSKQEPQIETNSSHTSPMPVDAQTVQVVDGIIRDRFDSLRKSGESYEVFKDLMSGGFSVLELYTDYENDTVFDQTFKIKRVFDPTLTGFDPMAGMIDKSDGNYCFCLYPRSLEDFKRDYPDADTKNLTFKSNAGFRWSYRSQKQDKIVLLCDFYEKQYKRVKLVKLSNGMTMTEKQYKKLLSIYQERQLLAAPPQVINERYTNMCTIHRYTFIETEVLEHEETDFTDLPLVFVDGNSIRLRLGQDGDVEQMTRPYLYHARDIQRLKNFAGQTLANELENMIQHKFKVAEESIPPEYRDAYQDVQHADVLVYKAFNDNNPDQPLPPPQEIVRTPIPPEVSNTFAQTDQLTQNILGSFDIQMGNLNASQLSGLAIQESVTQSNAVAMPYVVGYLHALTRIANNMVNLIPKYFNTPRTVPVLSADGKRSYARINDDKMPNGPSMDYPDNALEVSVEAGVNFTIQKTRALQQIISMMQASPLFAQFMNTEGLPILLDNLEIRGIDQLKLLADGYVKKMQMMQAKAQQQPNPLVLKQQLEQAKFQHQIQQDQAENQFRTAEVMNDANANTNDRMKIMLEQRQAGVNDGVQIAKANAETYSKAVDLALKADHQQHTQHLETTNQLHKHTKEALEVANQFMQTAQQAQQPSGANQNA